MRSSDPFRAAVVRDVTYRGYFEPSLEGQQLASRQVLRDRHVKTRFRSLAAERADQASEAKVDPIDSILSLSERLSKYGGGGMDCSLPLVEANQ